MGKLSENLKLTVGILGLLFWGISQEYQVHIHNTELIPQNG